MLALRAKAGQVDAALSRNDKPDTDVFINVDGVLPGQSIPINYGFKAQMEKALSYNAPGYWSGIINHVIATIMKEYS